ncbi:hypothetical protein WJX81_007086, partial [Elliptochloris bilobata]
MEEQVPPKKRARTGDALNDDQQAGAGGIARAPPRGRSPTKAVAAALEAGDEAAADAAVEAALQACLDNPLNPNRQAFLGAVAVFKRAPSIAALPRTYAGLLGLLRPPPTGARRSPLLALLAAVAVQRGFADKEEWPLELVLAYVDDLFGARAWADAEPARRLAAGLQGSFPPDPAPHLAAEAIAPGAGNVVGGTAAGAASGGLGGGGVVGVGGGVGGVGGAVGAVMERLRAAAAGLAARDSAKLFVRLLALGCRWAEGRALAAGQLEGLLNATGSFRPASLLLELLVVSVRSTESGDMAALGVLLGARVKAAHAALHARALERLALRRPEYTRSVLASLLWQDVREKGAKQHYVGQVAAIVRAAARAPAPAPGPGAEGPAGGLPPGCVEGVLAGVFHEIMAAEEARAALRDLCRRLAVAPHEARAANAAERRSAGIDVLLDEAAGVALASVLWCRDVVMVYLPGLVPARFRSLLMRMLFLDPSPTSFFTQGEAFGEAEAGALRLMSGRVVADEDLLTNVTVLGMMSSPLDPVDALGIVEALLRRTVAQAAAGRGVVPAAAAVYYKQLPVAVLELAEYVPPAAPLPPADLAAPRKLARAGDWWAALRFAEGDTAAAAEMRAYMARRGAEWNPPPGGVVRLAPGAPPRAVPDEFTDELFAMDDKYGLGAALRACREPDLLAGV